jgi:hypothetical protein
LHLGPTLIQDNFISKTPFPNNFIFTGSEWTHHCLGGKGAIQPMSGIIPIYKSLLLTVHSDVRQAGTGRCGYVDKGDTHYIILVLFLSIFSPTSRKVAEWHSTHPPVWAWLAPAVSSDHSQEDSLQKGLLGPPILLRPLVILSQSNLCFPFMTLLSVVIG